MKTQSPREAAQAMVAKKFYELYSPLVELINALQKLEPGGTLVDGIILKRDEGGHIHIEYVAEPIMLTIIDKEKKLILRVVNLN